MKRVEVGNIRVLLEDTGRARVDHPSLMVQMHPFLRLEPSEILDLQVALDGVSNDVPPDEETTLAKMRRVLQEVQHKLFVLGIRHRIEIHVDTHVLHDIANQAGAPPARPRRPDIDEVLLGPYGKLVAVRGKRV